jgi:hypothetical protein
MNQPRWLGKKVNRYGMADGCDESTRNPFPQLITIRVLWYRPPLHYMGVWPMFGDGPAYPNGWAHWIWPNVTVLTLT